MIPMKTPELMAVLTPALNAALEAAKAMQAARESGSETDTENVLYCRRAYGKLRDKALNQLDMATVRDAFKQADSAVDLGDVDAALLVLDQWEVAEHPTVTALREADEHIRLLEAELEQLRVERGKLTSAAMEAGITRYRMSKATGRSQVTVAAWRQADLQRKK